MAAQFWAPWKQRDKNRPSPNSLSFFPYPAPNPPTYPVTRFYGILSTHNAEPSPTPLILKPKTLKYLSPFSLSLFLSYFSFLLSNYFPLFLKKPGPNGHYLGKLFKYDTGKPANVFMFFTEAPFCPMLPDTPPLICLVSVCTLCLLPSRSCNVSETPPSDIMRSSMSSLA